MARKLSEIQKEIMQGVYEEERCFELSAEVQEAFTVASESEIEEFTDSGAGEKLYMLCSGIEYFRNKKE